MTRRALTPDEREALLVTCEFCEARPMVKCRGRGGDRQARRPHKVRREFAQWKRQKHLQDLTVYAAAASPGVTAPSTPYGGDMSSRPYIYRVTEVVKVTDGDTYWLRLDVGFRETLLVNLRLLGYDCPERYRGSTFEKSEAQRAARVATAFLGAVAGNVSAWVRTEKDPDSFGRWLGDVWLESDGDQWPERHLGAELRSQGLASVWPARWRDEFDRESQGE